MNKIVHCPDFSRRVICDAKECDWCDWGLDKRTGYLFDFEKGNWQECLSSSRRKVK